jgi:hypothetical protein
MKHLLTGAALLAALAIAAPGWAQPYGAGSGAQADQPVNPKAPYDRPVPPSWSQHAAPGSSAAATAPSSDTTSATPPTHRHARHVSHGKMAGHHMAHGKAGPQLTGNVANQLNQQELGRLQAGNFSNPAAPPGPGMAPPPGALR